MPNQEAIVRRLDPALQRLVGTSRTGVSRGRTASFGSVGGPQLVFTAKKYVGKAYSTQGAGTAAITGDGSSSAGEGAGTVSIYLPEEFSVSYGAAYEEMAMGATLNSLANGDFGDAASAMGSAAAEGAARTAGGFLGAEGAADAALQRQGIARNPNVEQLFKNVSFRQFTFNFKFHPNNPSEAQEIKRIVDIFKTAMHPELQGEYLTYPDTFDIQYRGNGSQYYNKFAKSVLTDMTYNYSGTGVTAQFKDGAPVESTLTLTFKEIEFLTKQSVQGGM